MLSAFIDDGYTREGRIAEEAERWPEIRFSYRPMTAAEYGEHAARIDKGTESDAYRVMSEMLARKVTLWNLRNRDGVTVKITSENLLLLVQPVFVKLWGIVSGREPSAEVTATLIEADAKN